MVGSNKWNPPVVGDFTSLLSSKMTASGESFASMNYRQLS